jgi:hypothetical protein
MFEAIIPNIFIDLIMGTLLCISIVLFHMVTLQVFIVGVSFDLYDKELFRWLSNEPRNIILYATPVIVHYATAAVIIAAASSQTNLLDVFIISVIPILFWLLREMQISRSLYESESADRKNPIAFLSWFLQSLKKTPEREFSDLRKFRIGLSILLLGGLTGKLVMALVHSINFS